jgi:parallel beta-helix repeat protein
MIKNTTRFLLAFAVIMLIFNSFFPFITIKTKGINTINVGGNGDGNFSSIQKAINASKNGDIIYIYNGSYKETLFINKSINLIGENKNNTIFNNSGKKYCIFIRCKNVSISNLTIKDSLIGIYVSSQKNNKNITISNILFYNNTNGLLLDDTSNNIYIFSNIFKNNSEGLRLYNSTDNIIGNNYFQDNNACIKFYGRSINNLIENNNLNRYGSGINFERWSNINSIIGNNISNGDHGIFLYLSNNIIIRNNIIFNNSVRGIFIRDCKNVTIFNNSIIKNGYYGLYIDSYEEYNMTEIIENNIFIDNEQDIQIQPKPPVIRIPSFEITLITIFVILSMIVFFVKIRHYKK